MKQSTVGFGASLLMAGIILAGCGSGSAETDSAADSGATEIKVGTGMKLCLMLIWMKMANTMAMMSL